MEKILNIDTIKQYNDYMGLETLHPLIAVVDLSQAREQHRYRTVFGFYALFFKDNKCGDVRYGRSKYDYEAGTLLCIGPQQVFNIEAEGEAFQPEGLALLFHPDLIRGTALGQHIRDYTFFSYNVNEALHLSTEERSIIEDCVRKIRMEIDGNLDQHSRKLIISNLELLLDYCMRFFGRQFSTRRTTNKDILTRFEAFLNDYFRSERPMEEGLPSVASCADKLNLSSNYFSDLIKKETGKTALDYIHAMIVAMAKEKMHDERLTVSEISYQLGFKYPQHFTRFFKSATGMTPNQWKEMLVS